MKLKKLKEYHNKLTKIYIENIENEKYLKDNKILKKVIKNYIEILTDYNKLCFLNLNKEIYLNEKNYNENNIKSYYLNLINKIFYEYQFYIYNKL